MMLLGCKHLALKHVTSFRSQVNMVLEYYSTALSMLILSTKMFASLLKQEVNGYNGSKGYVCGDVVAGQEKIAGSFQSAVMEPPAAAVVSEYEYKYLVKPCTMESVKSVFDDGAVGFQDGSLLVETCELRERSSGIPSKPGYVH